MPSHTKAIAPTARFTADSLLLLPSSCLGAEVVADHLKRRSYPCEWQ
jgi:hypothetical protein